MFGFRSNQPVVWFHKKLDQSNAYCIYCGADLRDGSTASNKEHLIGREFIPTGALGGTAFNLIFRSCTKCNERKRDLERHVSTLTLIVSPARTESVELDALALRKARGDFHPHKKGSAVIDAHASVEVPFRLGPVTGSFGIVGPPQMDTYIAYDLAAYHVQGFFSLITSVDPTTADGTNLLPARSIFYAPPYTHRDWGNPQLLEVVRRVQTWERLCVVSTANGFFRAEFRRDRSRNSGGTSQWFWALEWNKSTRVVGVIKDPNEALPLFADLPPLRWIRISPIERMREERPLSADQDDLLFRYE
ncbi:MAG: hypothetical protein Q8K82_22650 [Gemmatimonadaceae bacterium]|nr:hypothetical protein [Gemmatimonadaceae bacterium]